MFYFPITNLYECKTSTERETDLEVAASDSLYSERFDREVRHMKTIMIVDFLSLAIMNVPLPSDKSAPISFGHIHVIMRKNPHIQGSYLLQSSNLIPMVQTEQLSCTSSFLLMIC